MRGQSTEFAFCYKNWRSANSLLHAPEKVKTHKEYLDVVLAGLKAVVASGTGGATKLGGVEVAGKTGSAEAPPAGSKTHAWFACYAPADKPRIAICAFVEHRWPRWLSSSPYR